MLTLTLKTQTNKREARMLKSVMLACVSLWALAAAAQADPAARTQTGLRLATSQGVLTLDVRSDRDIHVRFGPEGYTGNYSPEVIAAPKQVDFTVSETPDAISLTTKALQVRVARADGRVTCLTGDGKTILEEAGRDLGHGVSQSFGTGTIVYGLGQHQNGMLDYTGSTVHLQQANRDVAV